MYNSKVERRKEIRREANLISEVWVTNENSRTNNFTDIGFRGTVANINMKGAFIKNFININVNGLTPKTELKVGSLIKLIVYFPKIKVDLIGRIRWFIPKMGDESAGIVFDEDFSKLEEINQV